MHQQSIGIVTLVDNLNYGNRLQNYAVDSIYRRLGLLPTTLINERVPVIIKVKSAVKSIIGRGEAVPNPSKDPRYSLFVEFNASLKFERVTSWRGLSTQYDLFSTGSDQIWNPWYSPDLHWPFLEFAKKEQRIALCPSIGIDTIPSKFEKNLRRGARGFDVLTVREDAGKAILDGLGCTGSTVLADPTIMLEPEDWMRVSDDSATPTEPYVFVYMLGRQTDPIRNYVEEVAGGKSVVALSDHCDLDGVLAGPAQFIDLIAKADAVVTDSFHGSVFSMLLDTPLTIVRRMGRGSELNSRIETFVKKFHLESALFDDGGGNVLLSKKVKRKTLDDERVLYLQHLSRYFDRQAIGSLASTLGLHKILEMGTRQNG